MRICPKCGFEIDNDDLFCRKCGAKQPINRHIVEWILDDCRLQEAPQSQPTGYFKNTALIEYVKKVCQRHLEVKRDYVQDILSMERCESIEGLISIFNDVFKLLAFDFYDGRDFPKNWYQHEFWGIIFSKHVQELCGCLNENILNWYIRQKEPTIEQCTACIVNLRECDNRETIQNDILRRAGDDVASDIDNLILLRKRHHFLRLGIYKTTNNSGKYNDLKNHYKHLSQTLAGNGRVFDVIEEAFAKEHEIDYKALLEQYQQEIEQKEIEVEQEEQDKKLNNLFWTVLLLFANVVTIHYMYLYFGRELLAVFAFYSLFVIIGIICFVSYYFLKQRERKGQELSKTEKESMTSTLIGVKLCLIMPIISFLFMWIGCELGAVGLIIIIGLIGGIPSLLLRGKL